jgi:ATP-dependent metalloprotease
MSVMQRAGSSLVRPRSSHGGLQPARGAPAPLLARRPLLPATWMLGGRSQLLLARSQQQDPAEAPAAGATSGSRPAAASISPAQATDSLPEASSSSEFAAAAAGERSRVEPHGAAGTAAASSSSSEGGAATHAASPSSSSTSGAAAPFSWAQAPSMLMTALVSDVAWLVAKVKSLPKFVQAQQLKKLKELADEDPKDADRHAAYLAELNSAGRHAEVISHVEAKEHASGAAAVAEYMRALVSSGRLSEYVAGSAAGLGLEGPPLGQAGGGGPSHRSLYQLLGEMRSQVAGEQPDDTPGTSTRRPLHVVVSGGAAAALASSQRPQGLLQVRSTSSHFPLTLFLSRFSSLGSVLKPRGSTRHAIEETPLGGKLMRENPRTLVCTLAGRSQVIWSLLRTALVLVAISLAWLVGSQAVRRVQSQPSGSAGVSMASATASSSTMGGPSTDPKVRGEVDDGEGGGW